MPQFHHCGILLCAPRNDIFSCFPACARHVPTNYCVLTLENCDFEIAWKFVKANLSWCLSFLHSASYISWSLVSSLLTQIWQEILISALVLQFAASVVWIKCILCLYVNAQAFVNIQRHMAAPRLIQNVWPGFLWISQRSIMQKNPNFWTASIMLFAALAADFLLAHCPSSSFRHLVCPLLSRDRAWFLTQLLCSVAAKHRVCPWAAD